LTINALLWHKKAITICVGSVGCTKSAASASMPWQSTYPHTVKHPLRTFTMAASSVTSTQGTITTACLKGAQAAAAIGDVADLRLSIFREFPYLFHGRREDELNYLRRYVEAPDAFVITVSDSGRVVGAATGIPLCHEIKELTEPFVGTPFAVEEIYYVGELLLYPAYRNRGLGLQLLAQIEDQVRSLRTFRYLGCATVVRPDDHPMRPTGYVPIDRFLHRTGFRSLPGVATSFSWNEAGGVSCEHPMQFWIKDLC
jgi:GNAT superfamily N-acetyltransferase